MFRPTWPSSRAKAVVVLELLSFLPSTYKWSKFLSFFATRFLAEILNLYLAYFPYFKTIKEGLWDHTVAYLYHCTAVNCYWSSPAEQFFVSSPVGTTTKFLFPAKFPAHSPQQPNNMRWLLQIMKLLGLQLLPLPSVLIFCSASVLNILSLCSSLRARNQQDAWLWHSE
jgi:hypothetical protein